MIISIDEAEKLAIIVTERLLEDYSIGNFSQFCDDPSDFDSVEDTELQTLIAHLILKEAGAILPEQN